MSRSAKRMFVDGTLVGSVQAAADTASARASCTTAAPAGPGGSAEESGRGPIGG